MNLEISYCYSASSCYHGVIDGGEVWGFGFFLPFLRVCITFLSFFLSLHLLNLLNILSSLPFPPIHSSSEISCIFLHDFMLSSFTALCPFLFFRGLLLIALVRAFFS